MNPTVALLLKILPLINDLTPVVAEVVSQLKAQTGKSLDEIISDTSVILNKNEADLLNDIAGLKK